LVYDRNNVNVHMMLLSSAACSMKVFLMAVNSIDGDEVIFVGDREPAQMVVSVPEAG